MMFQETQNFAPWATGLALGIFLIMLVISGFVFTNAEVESFVKIILLGSALISLIPFSLIKFSQLKTDIDKQSIRINFAPFSKKTFAWSEIETAAVINYGFVGGWGVRIGTKYGTVYNTQGSEGLLLKFKDGKSVVIGTQRRDELERFLDKAVSL